MTATKSPPTIALVFQEFLTAQKDRIGARTFLKYQSIIQLFGSYLEGYWPGHQDDYDRVTKAGGKYCTTFGPEDALLGYGEFLDYFMPRKVMCGKETMQAAGTVTKKLARWLADQGYVAASEDAKERAGRATKELPNVVRVLELLTDYCDEHAPTSKLGEIQDHFWIDRIEPGRLWLKPLTMGPTVIGPIQVPSQVTTLCRPGWDIGGAVVQIGNRWCLSEVWNVSP